MKVKELILRNYKGFGPDAAPISFCDDLGNVNPVTVLVGPNGSGKSSVLQAIAMLVGSMTRGIVDPRKFIWPGFKYEYIKNGSQIPSVEARMVFSEEEDLATAEMQRKVDGSDDFFSHEDDIRLRLNSRHDRIESGELLASGQYRGPMQHYMGYYYAMKLNGGDQLLSENLSKVGGIFWYPEQRQATDIHKAIYSGNFDGDGKISDSELRNILLRWFTFYATSSQPERYGPQTGRDRFAILKRLFETVFPGRTINRMAPDSSPERIMEDALIWFRDEKGQEYELSNASAGERAILPLLIDFANWEINHSIILIDEIELHLHPPLQQALIKALPSFGNDNQFIITTHSPHVITMVKPEQVRVLKGFEVSKLTKHTEGRDINTILTEIFGIEKRPKEFADKLQHFYTLLETQSVKEAEVAFEELESLWGTMDTEIVHARMFLEDLYDDLARAKEVSR